MNDPRTPFGKRAAELTRIKPDNLEKPIGQRLTEFRATEVAGEGNAFDREAARRPQPVVVTKASAPRTAAGNVETPELTAAREAEMARRAGIKAEAAKPMYELPEEADLTAIVEAFMVRHSADFYPSPFNCQNLIRLMKIWASEGRVRWATSGFEMAHAFLLRNGYYESARPTRGQPAPKEIPEERPAPVTTEPTNQVVKTRTVISADEMAELKNADFDQLAAHVRGGYKR